MDDSLQQELKDLKVLLQKRVTVLSNISQDKAIREWSRLNVAEFSDTILGFIGGHSREGTGDSDYINELVLAQGLLRLHPTQTIKNDIYQAIADTRAIINQVSEIMITEQDNMLSKIKTRVLAHEEYCEQFVKSGVFLQATLKSLKEFSLQDLLAAAKSQTLNMSDRERELYLQGVMMLSRITGRASLAKEDGKRSLEGCLQKVEDLKRVLQEKESSCEELKERLNTIYLKQFIFEPTSLKYHLAGPSVLGN